MSAIFYLKLGSGRDLVLGPSCDEGHNGWIKVESVQIGQAQTTRGPGGGGPPKVSLMDVSMTKFADQASPIIAQACQTGRQFSAAVIDFVDPATKLATFRLELKDVLVSSFQPINMDQKAGDRFSFTFSDVKMNDSPIPDAVVDKALKCSPVPAHPKHGCHRHHHSTR